MEVSGAKLGKGSVLRDFRESVRVLNFSDIQTVALFPPSGMRGNRVELPYMEKLMLLSKSSALLA